MRYFLLNKVVKMFHDIGRKAYYGEPFPVSPADTLMLIIDAQHLVSKVYLDELVAENNVNPALFAPLFNQIERINDKTVSNIAKLADACRKAGIEVIHIKIESEYEDLRDVGRLYQRTSMHVQPGHPLLNFLDKVEPLEGETVLKKTCSGVHVGTDIDILCKSKGIEKVIVTGFYTDQCVSTSVRDLADLGYDIILPTDACAAMSPQRHKHALESLVGIYAYGEKTKDLYNRISSL
ncbi:MAG: cysteine hydrolase family protein [Saccharofermentanales bacterium]|jgi:nicotinamidase-related amidase